MTKRTFAWVSVIFFAVIALGGAYWTFFGTHQIALTQAELQSKIDAKMPFTTKGGVTISNVELDLSDDKLGLVVKASATKFKTEYAIGARTKGDLRYDGLRGAFYFHPDTLKVTQIEANGKSVSDKLGGLIDKWVDSKKILDNKKELMAWAEEFAQSQLQNSAEYALTRVPVYTLPDDLKGTVVKAFLTDLEVKNGTVIAHLSLWQFTKWVVVNIVMFVAAIGFMIALLANPEWGTTLLILSSLGDS